ncbi:MAG: hypothetical protein BMS9Abin37_0382 [Acidobacteriota bacterium]|nr:MAG: hypothetical protein BMS9Abin37_0382 [Acidobacteriota bacterium]
MLTNARKPVHDRLSRSTGDGARQSGPVGLGFDDVTPIELYGSTRVNRQLVSVSSGNGGNPSLLEGRCSFGLTFCF